MVGARISQIVAILALAAVPACTGDGVESLGADSSSPNSEVSADPSESTRADVGDLYVETLWRDDAGDQFFCHGMTYSLPSSCAKEGRRVRGVDFTQVDGVVVEIGLGGTWIRDVSFRAVADGDDLVVTSVLPSLDD